MAELFGVTAGAVGLAGFAIQLINCVGELRELYLGIKNVPRDLEILLDEINLFSTVLRDLANEEQQYEECFDRIYTPLSRLASSEKRHSPKYLSAVISATDHCRKAAVELGNVLSDIHEAYKKKGPRQILASVQFVLHKKEVTQGLQKLERVKSLLSISHQCLLQ